MAPLQLRPGALSYRLAWPGAYKMPLFPLPLSRHLQISLHFTPNPYASSRP